MPDFEASSNCYGGMVAIRNTFELRIQDQLVWEYLLWVSLPSCQGTYVGLFRDPMTMQALSSLIYFLWFKFIKYVLAFIC